MTPEQAANELARLEREAARQEAAEAEREKYVEGRPPVPPRSSRPVAPRPDAARPGRGRRREAEAPLGLQRAAAPPSSIPFFDVELCPSRVASPVAPATHTHTIPPTQDRGREESSGRGWAGGPGVPPKVEEGDRGGEVEETGARCERGRARPALFAPHCHSPAAGARSLSRTTILERRGVAPRPPAARRSNCPQGTEPPRPGREETSSIPNGRPCSRSEHAACRHARASTFLDTARLSDRRA